MGCGQSPRWYSMELLTRYLQSAIINRQSAINLSPIYRQWRLPDATRFRRSHTSHFSCSPAKSAVRHRIISGSSRSTCHLQSSHEKSSKGRMMLPVGSQWYCMNGAAVVASSCEKSIDQDRPHGRQKERRFCPRFAWQSPPYGLATHQGSCISAQDPRC